MKFGLSKKEYQFILREIVEPLTKKNAQVWCFGSRARGEHSNFSDLDLLVDSNSIDIDSTLSDIREKLEESNFPFKVDIILKKDLADSYKEQVLQEKKGL